MKNYTDSALDAQPIPASAVRVSGLVFTRFTNAKGPLTKRFTVNPDDPNARPKTTTSAKLYEGTAETIELDDIGALPDFLRTIGRDQALAFGVMGRQRATVAPKADLREGDGRIARDRKHFSWRSAPGILMLDHDAGYLPERYDDAEALRDALFAAVPALACAPMVWTPSASSFIENGETGHTVRGAGGARLYIPVADASDVPRALRALREYLWAAGIGEFSVSVAGRLLERTLVDLSTATPEHLDFVAGADCLPPLVQRRPDAIVFDAEVVGGLDPCPSHILLSDPDRKVREQADENRAAARARAEPGRQRVRALYRAERVSVLVGKGVSEARALDVVNHALDHDQLFAEFVLHPEAGGTVTVAEVLDDPKRWHGARFADPLEPGYGNDGRIAYANLRGGGRPYVFSHAHGGNRFGLFRQPAVLQVNAGDAPRIADACIDLLAVQGQVFDSPGGGMLRVGADGRLYPVVRPWLQDHLGRVASFQRFDRRSKGSVPIDAPPLVVDAILSRDGQRGLAVLTAVVTAPTMRVDGSVIDAPGYDAPSELRDISDTIEVPRVPAAPKMVEVMAALRALWHPISEFPYDGPVSRGVALAAMLTSCVRRALPTAPGFAIDAPAAGTGKTLLARCIAALGGHAADTTPLPGVEEERRKLIFALLRAGVGCITFDNVSGVLSGEAFDQAMTSPVYRDRVLSESRTEAVPNRALVLITGNNFRTRGDTNRRVLRCRINAGVEQPYKRSFAFNPAQFIEARRHELVAAALTIIRGYLVAAPRNGCLASFEEWDHLVRNAVVWLAGAQDEVELADPVSTIDEAEEGDGSRDALLRFLEMWQERWGDSAVTAAGVLKALQPDDRPAADFSQEEREAQEKHLSLLRSAVRAESRKSGEVTTRELGEWLATQKDVIAAGRRLEFAKFSRNKVAEWRVTGEALA